MKLENYAITMVLILVLLLSGCTSKNPETPITDANIYEGTKGLEIEFLTDTPPAQAYEGENFQVVALLKNLGAYPINRGHLVLTAPEDDFNVSTISHTFRLRGKNLYDLTDDQEIKKYYLKTGKLSNLSRTRQSIILVTACYDYATKLSTEVCIDTDPHNIKTIEKPCESKTVSFSGQGAPVTVRKVEQKMISAEDGIRPQFKIYIENDGKGEVVAKNKISQICSGAKIEKKDVNGIILKDISFSKYKMTNIECLPETLKLVGGEDYFVCTLKKEDAIPNDEPTFQTSLYLEFEYGYTITESREIEIKKITT